MSQLPPGLVFHRPFLDEDLAAQWGQRAAGWIYRARHEDDCVAPAAAMARLAGHYGVHALIRLRLEAEHEEAWHSAALR